MRYTMDAQDLYDGDRPLRDTDIMDRLNEQDEDIDQLRAERGPLLKAAHLAYAALDEVLTDWYADTPDTPPASILNAHAALYGLLGYKEERAEPSNDLPF